MRAGLAGALTVVILVSPAHACRLHSIWHYPFKERCPSRFVAQAPPPDKSWFVEIAPLEITLPSLADIDWGERAQLDAEAFGRLMLRAKMEDR